MATTNNRAPKGRKKMASIPGLWIHGCLTGSAIAMATVTIMAATPASQNSPTTQPIGSFFAAPPADPNQAPQVRQIPIPSFRGNYGVFGATGRDSRGHIWLGVAAHKVESP